MVIDDDEYYTSVHQKKNQEFAPIHYQDDDDISRNGTLYLAGGKEQSACPHTTDRIRKMITIRAFFLVVS